MVKEENNNNPIVNLNRSNESINDVQEVLEESIEEKNSKINKNQQINEKRKRSNKKDINFNINNFNPNYSSISVSNFSNMKNRRLSHNLVKSISRQPSSIQNNITFCNNGLIINSKFNSQGLENSMYNNYTNNQYICQYCNCFNNLNNNINNNFNNSQTIRPFKLVNNVNSTSEILNTDNYVNCHTRNKSSSPIKDISTKEFFSKKDSANKPNNFNKITNENLYNEICLDKNIEKSPDKELVKNLKKLSIFNSTKGKNFEGNNLASINNTPIGTNTFNLTSPNNINSNNLINQNNNYLITSDIERGSMKGRYEVFRNSILSNPSNRKIKEDGINFSELKMLRKEIALYKNCFDSISNEFNNFKFNEKYKEEALEKFYDENRIIFEKEVACFWKALKVYKEIFTDQIKTKENKICEMSKIFDDMVIGENSILMSNNANALNNTHFNNVGSKIILN